MWTHSEEERVPMLVLDPLTGNTNHRTIEGRERNKLVVHDLLSAELPFEPMYPGYGSMPAKMAPFFLRTKQLRKLGSGSPQSIPDLHARNDHVITIRLRHNTSGYLEPVADLHFHRSIRISPCIRPLAKAERISSSRPFIERDHLAISLYDISYLGLDIGRQLGRPLFGEKITNTGFSL
jgi:hypothetical protein